MLAYLSIALTTVGGAMLQWEPRVEQHMRVRVDIVP